MMRRWGKMERLEAAREERERYASDEYNIMT